MVQSPQAMFLHDEIQRQPTEVQRILSSPIDQALNPDRPIRFIGIGTSLHACRVAEFWLREATGDQINVRAEEAHYFALHGTITPETQIVVVSHRGTKRFPNEVLLRARAVGSRTIAITSDSKASPTADYVLRTCSPDKSSTHTVSYTSALAVLARLVMNTLPKESEDLRVALQDTPRQMRFGLQLAIPDEVRNALVHSSRVLVTGFGIDAITADEAALKLKEGTYKWADSLTTEFALHGPPASYDDTLCALLIQPTADDGGRAQTLESVLRSVGAYAWTVGVEGFVRTAECHALARPFITVLPFQQTVANVADDMGTNPDSIRTDTEPWKTAMTSFQL